MHAFICWRRCRYKLDSVCLHAIFGVASTINPKQILHKRALFIRQHLGRTHSIAFHATVYLLPIIRLYDVDRKGFDFMCAMLCCCDVERWWANTNGWNSKYDYATTRSLFVCAWRLWEKQTHMRACCMQTNTHLAIKCWRWACVCFSWTDHISQPYGYRHKMCVSPPLYVRQTSLWQQNIYDKNVHNSQWQSK